MALLDDILLGNTRRRNMEATRSIFDRSRVENITERGIQISKPDTRASTALAGSVLLDTLGYLPESFGKSSAAVLFDKREDGQALQKAGVKKGMSLDELSKIIRGRQTLAGKAASQGGRGLLDSLLDLTAENVGNRNARRAGNVNAGNITEDYLARYNGMATQMNNTGISAIAQQLDEQDYIYDSMFGR